MDSVDVTLDGFLMRIASRPWPRRTDSGDEGLEAAPGHQVGAGRNFTFDADDAYSKADVDSVRKQLAGPGWSALVQVHKREDQENVDVYICMEGDKIKGLAVIASEPREFTIVNIIGIIDIDKIAQPRRTIRHTEGGPERRVTRTGS